MFDDEQDTEANQSSADGIARCLNMLAEEAASLNLIRTLEAIQTALQACQDESMLPIMQEAIPRVLH